MKPQERIIQLQKMVKIARDALYKIDYTHNHLHASEALENMLLAEMGKTHAIEKSRTP